MKRARCAICNRRDCKGWQPGDPVHEYRGKNSWNLGCHCEACCRSRDESGGFFGALADALNPSAQGEKP